MFSQVSVSHPVRGSGYPWSHVRSGVVGISGPRPLLGGWVYLLLCPFWDGYVQGWGGEGHVDKRAVCILLECFLVEMNSP